VNIIEQYKSAGISPWNNNWSNNHDFTSIPDGKNYSLLDKVIDFSTKKNDEFCSDCNRMKTFLNIYQFQLIHRVDI